MKFKVGDVVRVVVPEPGYDMLKDIDYVITQSHVTMDTTIITEIENQITGDRTQGYWVTDRFEKVEQPKHRSLLSAYEEKLKCEQEDAKTGDGKPRWSLLPYDALEQVVKVQEFGAKKYPIDSWKAMSGDYKRRYKDAAQRHLAAMMKGEEIDKESGLPHAAHLACNALFLTYFEIETKYRDNL